MNINNSKVSLFEHKTCGDFAQTPNLIWATLDTTFSDAINKLKEHNISAMPIYDEQNNDWISIISHTDLTMTAIHFIHEAIKNCAFNDNNVMIDDVLNKITIRIISRDGPLSYVNDHDNINIALNIFNSIHHKQLHRLAIKKDGDVIGVLSQLDLIRYIHKNINNVNDESTIELLNTSVDKMFKHALSSGLTTIEKNVTVLQAMEKLYEEQTHCLCVVDNNKFISGFSFSSVRYLLSTRTFSILNKSILEFVNEIQKIGEQDHEQRLLLMQIEPNFKFKDVIRRIAECGFHRLFVTDESGHPFDMITLTDVLNYF